MLFLSKCRGESHNRDEGLDLAGAMGQATIFYRDAHRSADQGAVIVYATASVCLQCWAGLIVKFCDQPVDRVIGPRVEKIGVGELGEGGFHVRGLFKSTLFDTVALIRRKSGKSLLKSVDVEEGDGKGADAAAGAAEPAGNFTEQRGGGPLKPAIGVSIERCRLWRRWICHGGSFFFDGNIDDEIALG